MGVTSSSHPAASSVLDGSEWIRTLVKESMKENGGISEFERFTVEPAHTVSLGGAKARDNGGRKAGRNFKLTAEAYQEFGVRLFRVVVAYRDAKKEPRVTSWVVKQAAASQHAERRAAITSLLRETKVHCVLLKEMREFLSGKTHPRAKHLINVPEMVTHEQLFDDGVMKECLLVLEDVRHSKRCEAVDFSALEGGLGLRETRVLLGSLAQFHAVGLAWKLARVTAAVAGRRPTSASASSATATSGDALTFLLTQSNVTPSRGKRECTCWEEEEGKKEAGEKKRKRKVPRAREGCQCERAKMDALLVAYAKLIRHKWCSALKSNENNSKSGNRPLTRSEEEDLTRRLKLIHEFRSDLSLVLSRGDDSAGFRSDTLSAPCLGPILPTDVMFQRDELADLMATAAVIAGDDNVKDRSSSSPSPPPPPALSCAALLSCHRAHLGPLTGDVALVLTASAAPHVRRRYTSPLLLGYAQTLTATLEMLDVDWARQFDMTFVQLLRGLYDQLPRAVMHALLIHMSLTDPVELRTLVGDDDKKLAAAVAGGGNRSSGRPGKGSSSSSSRRRFGSLRMSPSTPPSAPEPAFEFGDRHYWLPLTEARIDFLVGLTDAVLKVV